MRVEAAGATHVGQRRDGNEDSYLIDGSLGLHIVCDGMGGHAAGEIASARSIALVVQHLRENNSVIENAANSPDGYFRVVELVEAAIQEACSQ